MKSIKLNEANLKKYDLVVLSTDHSNFDYKFFAKNADLIVDTRNAFETRKIKLKKIFKA